MNLFSLLAFAVYAAGAVISPIPDDIDIVTTPPPKPDISFGQIVAMPTPDVLAATTAAPTPVPPPPPLITKKKNYTIAFLGDSMIDTMGPDLPAVQTHLHALYSMTNFTLKNFGVGATNLDDAIARIATLAGSHPDIVVLESCAYNPYPNGTGVDRHWLALAKAVDALRSSIPGVKIIIAATIAPNSTVFGDGAAGISFSAQEKMERVSVIKQYLDSTVQFAESQHLPLADAYHASLNAHGDGALTYINTGDHIHYSDAGRNLFAQKVVHALEAVL